MYLIITIFGEFGNTSRKCHTASSWIFVASLLGNVVLLIYKDGTHKRYIYISINFANDLILMLVRVLLCLILRL